MNSTAFLDRLNAPQRRAVTHGQPLEGGGVKAGPLLIVAGAGTGKTDTLAHRVAWLVLNGVDPGRILLLTFTRRAAQEMRRRAQEILRKATAQEFGGLGQAVAQKLDWAGTFHSVGNRLLRHYAPQLALDPQFSVMDRGDSADLIDVIRQEQGLAAREQRFPRKETCLAIYSYRVNTRLSLEQTLERQYPWCLPWAEDLAKLFRSYVERKQRCNVLDYDDLLLYWNLMMGEPRLAQHVGTHFDHVLVDEYQDTNRLQGEILYALKPDGAGLTVVGDDAQSIYSFRAADVENILEFPDRFTPRAEIVTLAQNYRSTQPVLDAANAVMAEAPRQHRKQLISSRGGGAPPRLVTVDDPLSQADYVGGEILRRREQQVPLKQQAVLFRTSSHSDLLEVELARRKIPFVKYGGLKFLEAAHIKDLLAVLRWADNPRNVLAAFRTLQLLPGMGPANGRRALEHFEAGAHTFASLATFQPPANAAAAWPALVELMQTIGDAGRPWPGQVALVRRWYQPHLERLYEQVQIRAGDLDQLDLLSGQYVSRERFLTELALDPPNATSDRAGEPLIDEDYLTLSTIHSAKGMEWDSVYLLNVVDGSFPSEFATGSAEGVEEERRLLYVAMTRAKSQLTMMTPLRFHLTGQHRHGDAHVYGGRSRFLTDKVLATLEATSWRTQALGDPAAGLGAAPRVDVAQRLKDMW